MLKNWTVTMRFLSPQLINSCPPASATKQVALCKCVVCMCIHMFIQVYLPVEKCLRPELGIRMTSSVTSPCLFIYLCLLRQGLSLNLGVVVWGGLTPNIKDLPASTSRPSMLGLQGAPRPWLFQKALYLGSPFSSLLGSLHHHVTWQSVGS